MLQRILVLLILSFTLFTACDQKNGINKSSVETVFANLNAGPYVFIQNNGLVQKKIVDGVVVVKELKELVYDTVYKLDTSVYSNVRNIAVLSDIHGQYDLAVELLKNNKIIDADLNWNFGKDHLVIVGDIFDRGDKVNEMLWLVYKLEYQAKEKGGNVHFLMGNHEYMIFHKDLRYISEKDQLVSKALNLNFDALYSNETVLGRWLRSKPVIVKINDNIFVHGGISSEFLSKVQFDVVAINNTMQKAANQSKEELNLTGFMQPILEVLDLFGIGDTLMMVFKSLRFLIF